MMALLKNRTENIFRQRKGVVFDASTTKTTKLTEISSSEALMKELANGGCWYDDEFRVQSSGFGGRYFFLGGNDYGFEKLSKAADGHLQSSSIALLPYAAISGTPHQLMGKLYMESDLRESADEASINPETARKLELIDGGGANIKTENGVSKVRIRFDPAIMPGTIQVAVGLTDADSVEPGKESILEICKIENDSTWRNTKAEILPA